MFLIMLFLAGFVLWPVWAIFLGLAVSGNKPGKLQILVIALFLYIIIRSCTYT